MKKLFLMIFLFIFTTGFSQSKIITDDGIPSLNDYRGKERRTFKLAIADIKHIVDCSNYLPQLNKDQSNDALKGINEAKIRLEKRCKILNISNKKKKKLIKKYSEDSGYDEILSYILKSKTEYFRNIIIRRGRVALV